MLDIYDMQLVSYGRELIHYRNDFIDQMNGIIRNIHFNLSGGKEELEIRYEPNTEADVLEKALKKSRMQDLRQKTTLTGPHRDDISFYVNNIDIRKFGSQGQQRTAALSLKLAEIELVKKIVKDYRFFCWMMFCRSWIPEDRSICFPGSAIYRRLLPVPDWMIL